MKKLYNLLLLHQEINQNFNKFFKNNFKKKDADEMNKVSRTNNTIFNDGKDYASLQNICKNDLNQKEKNQMIF